MSIEESDEREVRLPGGQVGGAVRVGDTVRRPTGPWTPAVHALLAHLAARGLDGIPAVLGFDEQDREVLTYVPGRPIPLDEVSEAHLVSAAAWLRRFHAAVADFRPGARRWRFVERDLAPDEIVCHHDAAMYNLLAGEGERADEVIGVVDWDVAGPGTPLDDLAHLAWSGVPLYDEPDVTSAARRLGVLTDAYGEPGLTALRIAEHVVVRVEAGCARIAAGQRAGDAGMLNLAAVGEPARTLAQRQTYVERTLPLLHAALPSGGVD